MIRAATPADIGAIVDMGRAMHGEGAFGFLRFVESKAQATAALYVVGGARVALVSEVGGQITGMIGGALSEYFFGDQLIATELVWYVKPERRGKSDGIRLLCAFEAWAAANGAAEVCIGVTTGMVSVGGILKRAGYAEVGGTYKRRLV